MPPISCLLPRMSWSVRSSASNPCLCIIVHSSNTMRLHSCSSFAMPVPFLMMHVGLSVRVKLSGNFKVERAVYNPSKEHVTAMATMHRMRILASSKFSRNVLPVPPGASRYIMPSCLLSTLAKILVYTLHWFDVCRVTFS